MSRVKGGFKTRRRRKKLLELAKGYRGARSKLYRVAKIQVMKSLSYAYRDRKKKKSTMRKLAIIRINAACRKEGLTYSQFINRLRKANININRQMLALLALENSTAFKELVAKVSS